MSTAPGSTNGGGAEDRAHQKSFKRKYRKLRHKFKEVMKKSDELFKQEQLAKQAMRRMQEENTRLLDLMVDLNSSEHISKELRHNIGSPSRASPPCFLSPTLYAEITGEDPTLLDLNNGGDADAEEDETLDTNGLNAESKKDSVSSSSDDDDDDEDEKARRDSKYNSEDDSAEEAYREETREWKYKRGIPGTPPRAVREKIKAEAQQERKQAEESAKKAAAEIAQTNSNGVVIKQEHDEDDMNGLRDQGPEAPRRQLIMEDYRRGNTPPYLRDHSPFLMTIEEEEQFYYEIDEIYGGALPTYEQPSSPSAAKAESDSHNPMSVHRWLRKNQPQVFLQGDEGEKKAGGRGRGGGRKKAAHDGDSGDEGVGAVSAKKAGGKSEELSKIAGAKRRRADTAKNGDGGDGGGTNGRGGGAARGGRGGGGRKKAEGEPPIKRQRSAID